MIRIFSFLVSTLLFSPAGLTAPSWGSKASQAAGILPHKLKPGQFIWKAKTADAGQLRAKISLPDQKIYLYRKGVMVAVSTISTGRAGHATPRGFFSVLGKSRFHRSKKYNNAPMPYTQWLTSKGVAMHAGRLPGYPASHGCIRMPTQFARLLYESSFVGMPVVITNQKVVITPPRVPKLATVTSQLSQLDMNSLQSNMASNLKSDLGQF